MYYYNVNGATLVSLIPLEGLGPEAEPSNSWRLFAAVSGDPMLGRGSFRVTHPGQLLAGHGLEVLDASRLPSFGDGPTSAIVPGACIPLEVDEAIQQAISDGRLTAVNISRPGWEDLLKWSPRPGRKRVNILAIGDVGSTLLTGLKLLGGDVISSIGICDLSDQITDRWEFEMGQINLPWDYNASCQVSFWPAGHPPDPCRSPLHFSETPLPHFL